MLKYLPTVALALGQAVSRHKTSRNTQEALKRLDQIEALRSVLSKSFASPNPPQTAPDLMLSLALSASREKILEKYPFLKSPPTLPQRTLSWQEKLAQDRMTLKRAYPTRCIYTFSGLAGVLPKVRTFARALSLKLPPTSPPLSWAFSLTGARVTEENFWEDDTVWVTSEGHVLWSAKLTFEEVCVRWRKLILRRGRGGYSPPPHLLTRPLGDILRSAWRLATSECRTVTILLQSPILANAGNACHHICDQQGWDLLPYGDLPSSYTGSLREVCPLHDVHYTHEGLSFTFDRIQKSLMKYPVKRDFPALMIVETNNMQDIPLGVRRPGRIDFIVDIKTVYAQSTPAGVSELWAFLHKKTITPPLAQKHIDKSLEIMLELYDAGVVTYLERVKLYGQDYEMPPWDMSFNPAALAQTT